MPWYVTAFLKLIGPFIDPVTKTKIKYNEPLTDHIPASQLMKASGGEIDFKYDHSVYWPALAGLAAERRQQKQARWEKAGKIIGESEIYLWGGDEPSIGGKKEENVEVNGEDKVGAQVQDQVQASAPVNGTTANGDAALVDGVANLDIKSSEPVKPTS